jgi:hypothetical protein
MEAQKWRHNKKIRKCHLKIFYSSYTFETQKSTINYIPLVEILSDEDMTRDNLPCLLNLKTQVF